jgi:tripartite-type tricarboxylate transporter receptor subunit TctC
MEKSMRYAIIVPAVLSLICVSVSASLAQGYPEKPVRVVVPWPPGGSNDVTGRIVFDRLSSRLKQRFVVDNRAGAGGTVGADQVAKSRNDGYTLLVQSTTHVANATLYKKLPYDTLNDFTPVATLSSQPGVLVVHPSLPARSVKEFVDLAKKRPGMINYSSSGNGSGSHMSMSLFVSMTKIDIVHVPFKGGAPQVTALVSGETQASLAPIADVLAHLNSKRLVPLGVSSPKPSAVLPHVPTIASAGVPGYEMNPWIGVFAPAGTPKPVVNSLNTEINAVLSESEIGQRLMGRALEPLLSTPDEFARKVRMDYEKYAKLIEITGARID